MSFYIICAWSPHRAQRAMLPCHDSSVSFWLMFSLMGISVFLCIIATILFLKFKTKYNTLVSLIRQLLHGQPVVQPTVQPAIHQPSNREHQQMNDYLYVNTEDPPTRGNSSYTVHSDTDFETDGHDGYLNNPPTSENSSYTVHSDTDFETDGHDGYLNLTDLRRLSLLQYRPDQRLHINFI